MGSNYLIKFLEEKEVPTITKKRHTYLTYYGLEQLGRKVNNGILIDFQVTNDDIAGFCGISTRNSVNRILRGLREENVITMVNQKIVVLDKDYLKQFIQA